VRGWLRRVIDVGCLCLGFERCHGFLPMGDWKTLDSLLDDGRDEPWGDSSPQTQIWAYAEKGSRVWGHYQIDEHFIQCIQGSKPLVSVKDAIKTQSIAARMT